MCVLFFLFWGVKFYRLGNSKNSDKLVKNCYFQNWCAQLIVSESKR